MAMTGANPPLLIQLKGQSAARRQGPHIVPPGRYYFVAQLPSTPEEIAELYQRFDEIINSLTYREAMAWCRGWQRSYSTYLARKYHHRKPSLEEVIITCQWADDGKPVTKKASHSIATFAGIVARFNSRRRYIKELKQSGDGDGKS